MGWQRSSSDINYFCSLNDATIDFGNVTMNQVFEDLEVFSRDKDSWGGITKNGCIQWDEGNQALEIY